MCVTHSGQIRSRKRKKQKKSGRSERTEWDVNKRKEGMDMTVFRRMGSNGKGKSKERAEREGER